MIFKASVRFEMLQIQAKHWLGCWSPSFLHWTKYWINKSVFSFSFCSWLKYHLKKKQQKFQLKKYCWVKQHFPSKFTFQEISYHLCVCTVCEITALHLSPGAPFLTRTKRVLLSSWHLQFYPYHIPGNKWPSAHYLSWGGCRCPSIHWRFYWRPVSAHLFSGQADPGGFSSRHPVSSSETAHKSRKEGGNEE